MICEELSAAVLKLLRDSHVSKSYCNLREDPIWVASYPRTDKSSLRMQMS